MKSYRETLTLAVRDLTEYGYDDPQRLEHWMRELEIAANADLPSPQELEKRMRDSMNAVYRRTLDGASRYHPGVSKFNLSIIEPSLRPELDRRILASANLIKLNRKNAIEKTLQRFSGWATSIPVGESKVTKKLEVKESIGKSVAQLKYEVRRLDIDQGHKLISTINQAIAAQSGAIAMEWRSNWKRKGYKFREEHKERDKKTYAIRGTWAVEQGLINKGDGYTDEMTAPAEEIFCSCWGIFIISLTDLPDSMLTAKGREWIKEKTARRVN